jgi:hypothetical protein
LFGLVNLNRKPVTFELKDCSPYGGTLFVGKEQSAQERQPVSDSDRVIADVCNGRTIWNSNGTDGACRICPPPAAVSRLPLPVPTQPKPALQRRRHYDLIHQL